MSNDLTRTHLHCRYLVAFVVRITMLTSIFLVTIPIVSAQENGVPSGPNSELLESQLKRAESNRSELETAIKNAPDNQRPSVEFLIANMPENDLQTLSSKFLLNNVRLATAARSKAPWEIPDEIFLNDVLPYANIDEPRDPWRESFVVFCWPIVRGSKTPTEAALKLNQNLFKKIGVKYSTQRHRANQSPTESMEQGLASCTGLSIILVDACRSVGVPARLVGIPSWTNKPGNHTWVEIWDNGWHFVGAGEPNPAGLNHAWFVHDAKLADPDSPMHSIYAASFKKTETPFPMVWSPEKKVYAENVTRRYLPADSPSSVSGKPDAANMVDVMIRVWNANRTHRIPADVRVTKVDTKSTDETEKTNSGGQSDEVHQGRSRGNRTDMNDMLTFELSPNSNYRIQISAKSGSLETDLKATGEPHQLFEFSIPR